MKAATSWGLILLFIYDRIREVRFSHQSCVLYVSPSKFVAMHPRPHTEKGNGEGKGGLVHQAWRTATPCLNSQKHLQKN